MIELTNPGYYPFTKEHLKLNAPARAGIVMLALRLPSGGHRTFYTSQSANILQSLRELLVTDRSLLPPIVQQHRDKNDCYFSYLLISKAESRNEVGKMLAQTMDPVGRLKVTEMN